jgi:hypothetical protein
MTALRTFAFAATERSDGSVTGQAQIHNRAAGGLYTYLLNDVQAGNVEVH